MKKIKWIIIGILIIVIIAIAFSFFLDYKKQEQLKIQRKNIEEKIKSKFASKVKVTKDSFLYKKIANKYQKIGKISEGEIILLKKEKITYQTKYFYIPKLDSYISYSNVEKTTTDIPTNTRYKNYLVFNENITTKNPTHLYRDNKLVYTLYESIDTPIIYKEDTGYYIEYLDELFFVNLADIDKTYEVENTTEEEATKVPVTVYHFIYFDGDNTCNELICHKDTQIREQFNYLKENDYFTLTTTELRLFIEGKLRLPKKSILVTIDDGARAEKFIPLLEEYQINATLFLISSWYPTEKFASPYMEIASHTHDLHKPGLCSGGQGSPLKCLPKEQLLADLKTSRETLNNTEAFCFPFYEYNDYALDIVKEAGFKIAFIGGMQKATKGINLLKVPRISMNRYTTLNEYINYIN